METDKRELLWLFTEEEIWQFDLVFGSTSSTHIVAFKICFDVTIVTCWWHKSEQSLKCANLCSLKFRGKGGRLRSGIWYPSAAVPALYIYILSLSKSLFCFNFHICIWASIFSNKRWSKPALPGYYQSQSIHPLIPTSVDDLYHKKSFMYLFKTRVSAAFGCWTQVHFRPSKKWGSHFWRKKRG